MAASSRGSRRRRQTSSTGADNVTSPSPVSTPLPADPTDRIAETLESAFAIGSRPLASAQTRRRLRGNEISSPPSASAPALALAAGVHMERPSPLPFPPPASTPHPL